LATFNTLAIKPRFGPLTRALIVDSHITTSNILASHLRMLGLGQVVQCARAAEALRHIQDAGFDFVLCEQRLADGTMGQDLIEELRRSARLSLRTVVMVISADAAYNTVAEVAESAVDGFVIRPYSPGGLEDRLVVAYRRKELLSPVFDAIEANRHADALKMCETLYGRQAPGWTHAARLGAELALRLDKPALASTLFETVLAVKAVPWAKLGLARTLAATGAAGAALSTIENLLATEPRYVDAYDVLGKLHAEQGDLQAALTAYRQASQITPASVQRAQKYGILAYYAEDPLTAQAALERAAALGREAEDFDLQTLLLLAMLHFRQKDTAALQACRMSIDQALATASQAGASGARPQRFAQIIQALDDALQGRLAEAGKLALALASGIGEPSFDIEAASNLMSLLAALQTVAVPLDHDSQTVRRLGLRFCVGRHATEVLAQACQDHPPHVATLRQAHAEIGEMAQAALGQVLAGDPQRAVEQLLAHTETTHNAKLLHSAQASLQRYRARIAEAERLQARCDELQSIWGSVARHSQPLASAEEDAPATRSPAATGPAKQMA
jgi:DNA-binding NarL/FixJ family response regulator/Tfp pilus assembly protein PilF